MGGAAAPHPVPLHPTCNKLISRKWDESVQKLHEERLANMKCSINNKAPARHKHLYQNAKREQMEEDRLSEIERQNGILLNKLSKIASRKGAEGSGLDRKTRALQPGEAAPIQSLNAPARKAELQRIQKDNQAILKRIQQQSNRKSTYDKSEMDAEWQKVEGYRKLASNHL